MPFTLIAGFFRRRLLRPVLNLLRQGMTPHKLAVTVALGTVVGILPFFGVTTVLGTALAARFRLNIAATVLVSYLAHPLQLLLFIPFVKAGVALFGLDELGLSLDEIISMFRSDWLGALGTLWVANLAGVSVWVLTAMPIGAALYLAWLPILRKVMPKPAIPEDTTSPEIRPVAATLPASAIPEVSA